MDLAPLVRAVEALMSPLDWGGRDAWLAESLRRVREACGAAGPDSPADPAGELETLLRLPHDEPGWLHAALASADPERWRGPVPAGSPRETVTNALTSLSPGYAAPQSLRNPPW